MKFITDKMKALSDETRLKLLCLLSKRACCVCELAEVLDMAQPTITRHLQKLELAGLISVKRCGNFQIYYLDPKDEEAKLLLDFVSERLLKSKELKPLFDRLDKSEKKNEIVQKCKEVVGNELEGRD